MGSETDPENSEEDNEMAEDIHAYIDGEMVAMRMANHTYLVGKTATLLFGGIGVYAGKKFSDDETYINGGKIANATVFFVTLIALLILDRICMILPIVALSALIIMDGAPPAILTLAILIYSSKIILWIWTWARYGSGGNKGKQELTPELLRFLGNPYSPTPPALKADLKDIFDFVIVITLFVCIALALFFDVKYAQYVMMTGGALLFLKFAPFTGANASGVVMVLMVMLMMAMAICGPALAELLHAFVAPYAAPVPLPPMPPENANPIPTITHTIGSDLYKAITTMWVNIMKAMTLDIDLVRFSDIVRMSLPAVYFGHLIADSFKGPRAMLENMMNMTPRGINPVSSDKVPEARKVDLSIYFTIFCELVTTYAWRTGTHMAILLTGLTMGFFLWEVTSRGSWASRGIWAKMVSGRTDTTVVKFDGPGTTRKVVVMQLVTAAWICLAAKNQMTFQVGVALVLVWMVLGNEQLLMAVFGVYTQGWGIILLSIFKSKPITADLEKGLNPAGDPGLAPG